MQDEEGYMALNIQRKKRSSSQASQLKFKDYSVMLRWYKIFLGISGTVNGILVLTFISLILLESVQSLSLQDIAQRMDLFKLKKFCFQVSQGLLLTCQNENNSNTTQHDIGNLKVNGDKSGNIRDKDSDPFVSEATHHSGLCPSGWLRYQQKCYWFSSEMKSWKGSYEYCLERKSHLLMIYDQLEMVFIQKYLKQSNYMWIGLSFTSMTGTWTWVDGSPLDSKSVLNAFSNHLEHLKNNGYFIKGPDGKNSCAAIRGNNIYSETCNSVLKWICQY